jgi:hypothetical protein
MFHGGVCELAKGNAAVIAIDAIRTIVNAEEVFDFCICIFLSYFIYVFSISPMIYIKCSKWWFYPQFLLVEEQPTSSSVCMKLFS